jgi:ribose/xylose/arabinose/galactoside ABC-type transport system permease subunit
MHIAYVDLIEPLKEEGKGEQTNNCSHVTWFGQERIIRLPITIIIIIILLQLVHSLLVLESSAG